MQKSGSLFLNSQVTDGYGAVTDDLEILQSNLTVIITTKVYFMLTVNVHHGVAMIPLDVIIPLRRLMEQLLFGSLSTCGRRK